ncbi:MAG: ERF family protein [Candidatus Onthovivens sp.]|nr:ERF family protein [Candidatus Onthovivens sp.]
MERKNTIKKNKEGYGYTYTDITAINNYCMENGITYYQEVETCEINGKDYIITYLTENEETKRYRGCEIVQATLQGIKNPVQEYGSSLTYCRRYSLLMALGLATEDNDAQDLTISTINTKEDALKMTINFGKYKGKTLNDIQDDESYLEWLFANSKDENMVKSVSLITGWETKTDDQMKEAVKLLTTIKDLMSAKNIFSEELIETFGKKSNEMTNEELKEVIKWLESYDKLGEK